jgi:alpha-galactosidase
MKLNTIRLIAGLFFGCALSGAAAENSRWIQNLQNAPASVVLADGTKADSNVLQVKRSWNGSVCTSIVVNTGKTPMRLARVDLFDFQHGLPGSTPIYGESFQMLAQNGGTLAAPEDWGNYPDRKHYRLEEPDGLRTAHGMIVLRPAGADQILLGYGSCRRFDGRISFDAKRLLVSLDCEGLELAPGESWPLEEFFCEAGPVRETLLDHLAQRIEKNHPRRTGFKTPPLGWCSWYCFGPKLTVPDIRRNLDWIAANLPQLRYIQIDDGYQPWMGDWLETGKSFGGDIKGVLREIRERGFEPAIWLAPFVASPESKLFHDHPDWFVKDANGQPLRSDKVGFGGWRLGPWYALDGTNPDAQKFLEQTFRTMRQEWGCTYFKLDANYWGALRSGHFYDPKATRIEAYRRGMEAALRGAGDAFILGCNHPIWPSLGLVDGARSGNDISRDWHSIRDDGRQNLLRGWENGRFWWNDPDCAVLSPGMVMDISGNTTGATGLPPNEVLFHATTVHASGGMMLSGDDLPALAPERVAMLKKLIPPTGRAASFADETLTVGRTPNTNGEYLYLFNWGDAPAERVVSLPRKMSLKNYWTGEPLGEHEGEYRVPALAPHTALMLEATGIGKVKPDSLTASRSE